MLSENIRTIRKNKGYSQEELASKLFVTRQTISKWETGQSVPNADMLKQMADLFEVSVSELVEGDAERVLENAVIVDQLARVNEHLTINQKRSKRTTKIVIGICIALAIIIAVCVIIGLNLVRDKKELGREVRGWEHIGTLCYTFEQDGFYQKDRGTFLVGRPDGTFQIYGKRYSCYDDMTVVTINRCVEFDQKDIDEFKEKHSKEIRPFSGEHGTLSKDVDFYLAASDPYEDECDVYGGSYYSAYISLGGTMYTIEVIGGDNPFSWGESLASTMHIDKSLPEEYVDPSSHRVATEVNATGQIPGSDAYYSYDGPSIDDVVSISCPDGFEVNGSVSVKNGTVIARDVDPIDGDGGFAIRICLEQFGDQVTPYSCLQTIDFDNRIFAGNIMPKEGALEVEGNPAYYFEDMGDQYYVIKHGDAIISIRWDEEAFTETAKELLNSLRFKSSYEARQES